MIEKITVSRDEVLHYSWIDHTWVYVHYTKNSITKNPLFSKIIKMLLKRGMLETTGKKIESIIIEDGYVFIKYDTDEIIEILKNASLWIITSNLQVKDPLSPIGKFFLENKNIFYEFFDETSNILEHQTYEYYFKSVDGLD